MLGGAQVKLTIDESKVTVITRAQRLRTLNVLYLTALRDAAKARIATGEAVDQLTTEVSRLDEIIAWLNEMES